MRGDLHRGALWGPAGEAGHRVGAEHARSRQPETVEGEQPRNPRLPETSAQGTAEADCGRDHHQPGQQQVGALDPAAGTVRQQAPVVPGQVEPVPDGGLGQAHAHVERTREHPVSEQGTRHPPLGCALPSRAARSGVRHRSVGETFVVAIVRSFIRGPARCRPVTTSSNGPRRYRHRVDDDFCATTPLGRGAVGEATAGWSPIWRGIARGSGWSSQPVMPRAELAKVWQGARHVATARFRRAFLACVLSAGYPSDRPLSVIERLDRRPFDEVVHRGRW